MCVNLEPALLKEGIKKTFLLCYIRGLPFVYNQCARKTSAFFFK